MEPQAGPRRRPRRSSGAPADRASAPTLAAVHDQVAADDIIDALVGAALAVRANAYAPYSGYAVGAALLADDGTVYRGCNVENASYPAGICAERTALVNAVSAGRRAFIAIAVAVDGPQPASPCGICRQMLSEFAPQLRIIMATTDGQRIASDLAALLPSAFGQTDLGERPSLS